MRKLWAFFLGAHVHAQSPDPLAELKDIKPLLPIPDSSIYFFWGLVIAGVVLVGAVLTFIGLKFWRKRRKDERKRYVEILRSVDWDDPKHAAYTVTHYGRLLAKDDRSREIFAQLLPLLERYKYKPQVDPVDEETLRHYQLFLQVIDESV